MTNPLNPQTSTNSTQQIEVGALEQQKIHISRKTQALARETVLTLQNTKESLIRDMASRPIPLDAIPSYFTQLNNVQTQIQELSNTLNENISTELSSEDKRHLALKAKELGQERAGALFDLKQPEVSKILSGK